MRCVHKMRLIILMIGATMVPIMGVQQVQQDENANRSDLIKLQLDDKVIALNNKDFAQSSHFLKAFLEESDEAGSTATLQLDDLITIPLEKQTLDIFMYLWQKAYNLQATPSLHYELRKQDEEAILETLRASSSAAWVGVVYLAAFFDIPLLYPVLRKTFLGKVIAQINSPKLHRGVFDLNLWSDPLFKKQMLEICLPFNLEQNKTETFKVHTAAISRIFITPNNETMIISSADKTIKIWHQKTNKGYSISPEQIFSGSSILLMA